MRFAMQKKKSSLIIIAIYGLFAISQVLAESPSKLSAFKEERELSGFKNIIINGNGKLFIKQGKKSSLRIEAPAELLPEIKNDITNENLYLGPKDNSSATNKPVHYHLTLKQLDSINASGNIEVLFRDSIHLEKFFLLMNGSSKANLKLKVKQFKAQINGSSFVMIQGTTDEQSITIAGSGEFSGKKFSSNITHVQISGAGVVEANAKQELDVKIQGAGQVRYYGRPKISQEISGSGEIIPLG